MTIIVIKETACYDGKVHVISLKSVYFIADFILKSVYFYG